MVWLGRLNGAREMDRVYGPDLMLLVCELAQKKGYTHFLYGGARRSRAGIAAKAARQSFPG